MTIAAAKSERGERKRRWAICRALTDRGIQEEEEFHNIARHKVMSNIRSDITRYRAYILLRTGHYPR